MAEVKRFEKFIICPITEFEKILKPNEQKKQQQTIQLGDNLTETNDNKHFKAGGGLSLRDVKLLNYLKGFGKEITFNGKNIVKILDTPLKIPKSIKFCKQFWKENDHFSDDQKLLIEFLRIKNAPTNKMLAKKIQKKIRKFEKLKKSINSRKSLKKIHN